MIRYFLSLFIVSATAFATVESLITRADSLLAKSKLVRKHVSKYNLTSIAYHSNLSLSEVESSVLKSLGEGWSRIPEHYEDLEISASGLTSLRFTSTSQPDYAVQVMVSPLDAGDEYSFSVVINVSTIPKEFRNEK